jgi:alpha-galactosidase
LDNGVGLTPPMGWNSWNLYGCDISEQLFKEIADAMVSTGLRDAGYQYLNLDDCWQVKRNKMGEIIEDKDRFPSGIKSLSEYAHSKGLKFGIYSDAGEMTCQKRPGGYGFEELDAKTYASWEVDYLKYDNCYNYGHDVYQRYEAMRDALNATGRPIYYSICNWGVYNPWKWGASTGNSWRTSDDISANWLSIVRNVDESISLAKYAGPGAWNDMDMLEVGIGNQLLIQEQRAHFAIWCVMKSPLILGLDIRKMSKEVFDILTNQELISVNQDPLGVAGDVIYHEGADWIIASPLSDGSRAVILWNRHTHKDSIPSAETESLYDLTIDFTLLGYSKGTKAIVRDLYLQKDVGTFTDSYTASVLWHDVAALKITPINSKHLDTNWRPWNQNPIQ